MGDLLNPLLITLVCDSFTAEQPVVIRLVRMDELLVLTSLVSLRQVQIDAFLVAGHLDLAQIFKRDILLPFAKRADYSGLLVDAGQSGLAEDVAALEHACLVQKEV